MKWTILKVAQVKWPNIKKYFLIINIFLYHLQYNYKYNQVSAWICGGGAVDVRFINATIFSIGKLRENKCTFFCFKFFTKYPTKSTIIFFLKKVFQNTNVKSRPWDKITPLSNPSKSQTLQISMFLQRLITKYVVDDKKTYLMY
jgi:hypothetical protein